MSVAFSLKVFNKLIRRYKYLEKGFEEEIKKVSVLSDMVTAEFQTRWAGWPCVYDKSGFVSGDGFIV